MRLVVENMHCEGCAKGVTGTVRAVDPSAQVEVRLDRKEIAVTGGHAGGAALQEALQAAGWKASVAAA